MLSHVLPTAYKEVIKFVKPAPVDELQTKKDKKQKDAGKKKTKKDAGNVEDDVKKMSLGEW